MSITFGETALTWYWRNLKFKFGDLNAQCHRCVGIKFKLVILNLATFEKFAKSPN